MCVGGILVCVLGCCTGLRAWVVYWFACLRVVLVCVLGWYTGLYDAGTRCHLEEGKRGGLGSV